MVDLDENTGQIPDALDFTEQVIEWHLRETREELLTYADMMDKAALNKERWREAPGLRLASKMLHDIAGVN